MSAKTYSIRDLATKYQLPASTLRYYEQLGILPNVIHTEKGARIYTQEHISRLEGILCFKRTGLPIAKIQEYYLFEENLDLHIDDIVTMMTNQEQEILKQIADLNDGLEHIRQKVYYYTKVKEALEKGEKPPRWGEVI